MHHLQNLFTLEWIHLINMMMKIMRYAEKMGLDIDELMEMTVLDAILLIEDTKDMWSKLKKEIG